MARSVDFLGATTQKLKGYTRIACSQMHLMSYGDECRVSRPKGLTNLSLKVILVYSVYSSLFHGSVHALSACSISTIALYRNV